MSPLIFATLLSATISTAHVEQRSRWRMKWRVPSMAQRYGRLVPGEMARWPS